VQVESEARVQSSERSQRVPRAARVCMCSDAARCVQLHAVHERAHQETHHHGATARPRRDPAVAPRSRGPVEPCAGDQGRRAGQDGRHRRHRYRSAARAHARCTSQIAHSHAPYVCARATDELIDVPYEENETKIMRFAHYLRHARNRRTARAKPSLSALSQNGVPAVGRRRLGRRAHGRGRQGAGCVCCRGCALLRSAPLTPAQATSRARAAP
jgi:hypothetical protein